jgi:carbamoyl-phosphate synthase small subunit
VAEVVFTTNMTGYQETFSDPSFRGQIVVMTAPQIGNYGVNTDDPESARPQVAGVICRELSRTHSNWRATGSLPEWLGAAGVPVLTEVDTRRLTKHLRSVGVMRGVIGAGDTPDKAALDALGACPSMAGLDLASVVSTREPYSWGQPDAPFHVVAYDYGIKRNILRLFDAHGIRVTVVPSDMPADDVLAMNPDGVFLSNGPGDPEGVPYLIESVRGLIGRVPIFGICLGHQILGLAAGGRTYKLPFGHHGANHPVRDLATGRIEITSQNHNFAVDPASVAGGGWEPTHLNLNDNTCEGLRHRELPVFCVQYHPEASPGPHDANYLFGRFTDLMASAAGAPKGS